MTLHPVDSSLIPAFLAFESSLHSPSITSDEYNQVQQASHIVLKSREIELVEFYYRTPIINATEYDQPRFTFHI